MTPEQRLNRVERILGLFVTEGRRWRVRSREQDEKMNTLINMYERDRDVRQAESQELNEKINILINCQMETSAMVKDLAKSQSETDRSLRAFLDSLRKGGNGNSSS